ncbi:tyrosine-type recombinase/integrase [Arsenophonus sp.]|uniref:tyrosine-type recombinase/integrase n=1 Tax=Arsenophonus sp. TaxID=1872640 RepID=UPI003878F9BF
MLIKPLTSAEVKNAKSTGRDYSIHDGFGLLLYVTKTGFKSWRFRYSHPLTKKRQTLTIGSFPEFTLAEAREEREKARRLVARGIDPNEVKRERHNERIKKQNQTVEMIARDWVSKRLKEDIRENTRISIQRSVFYYVIPLIGHISIHELKAHEVINIYKQYADRPTMLKRIISRTKNIMDHAVNTGIIDYNSLAKLNNAFPSIKGGSVASLSIDELPDFLKFWLNTKSHPSVTYSLFFQMLTMTRPNEANNATWHEINFDNKLWIIPKERMKNKKEHVIPLSCQAIDVLNKMKKIKKGDYIFYGARNFKKPITNGAKLIAINLSQFKKRATPHGFRAMSSTLLNENGFNPDIIEAALSHKSGNAIRDIYNRTTYLEQRRVMMQWLGDFIDSAKNGVINTSTGKKGLRVVNQ